LQQSSSPAIAALHQFALDVQGFRTDVMNFLHALHLSFWHAELIHLICPHSYLVKHQWGDLLMRMHPNVTIRRRCEPWNGAPV
jgi:hypothetical protein